MGSDKMSGSEELISSPDVETLLALQALLQILLPGRWGLPVVEGRMLEATTKT